LTIDIFARFHQFEHDRLTPPFLEGRFPFINLYPWIGKKDMEPNPDMTRQCFAQILSHGENPTSLSREAKLKPSGVETAPTSTSTF
jgi:hypothetical protein